MEYFIKLKGEKHIEAILKRLYDGGYTWRSGGTRYTPKSTNEIILLTPSTKSITTCERISMVDVEGKSRPFKEIILDDLFDESFYKETSLKLTSEYTAFLKDGYVIVGCQKIPFEKVEELYNLIYTD